MYESDKLHVIKVVSACRQSFDSTHYFEDLKFVFLNHTSRRTDRLLVQRCKWEFSIKTLKNVYVNIQKKNSTSLLELVSYYNKSGKNVKISNKDNPIRILIVKIINDLIHLNRC